MLCFSMVRPMIARWLKLYSTGITLMGRAAQIETEWGVVRCSVIQWFGKLGGMNYRMRLNENDELLGDLTRRSLGITWAVYGRTFRLLFFGIRRIEAARERYWLSARNCLAKDLGRVREMCGERLTRTEESGEAWRNDRSYSVPTWLRRFLRSTGLSKRRFLCGDWPPGLNGRARNFASWTSMLYAGNRMAERCELWP